ncbi:MAG TPA: ATP-binding protein [Candidatus Lokiarchaeia archaeon]
MDELKIIEALRTWTKALQQKKLFDRTISKDILRSISKEVINIIGVRRCGKSSLLILIMQKLNIKEELILYVNFEDPIFANDLNLELLDKIWDIYRIKLNPDKKPYIFFDEIQFIPKWEKWIKKIRDLEQAYVFVTGSSSQLLSRDFGTSLTGRHISFALYPLSFSEYLLFKNFELPKSELEFIDKKIWLQRHFYDYLIGGGFPEFVLENNPELLKNYFDDMLYKDVIMRHEIRDANLLRQLANYCLSNIANLISFNSLKNFFKVSFETIKAYLSYLEECILIFQIPIFSYSLKVQEVNPKKIYCIDNGLRNAVSFKFSKDEGKLAENLVFLELKRRKKEIFYWQGKKEVDFVIKEPDDTLIAMNVSFSDDIEEREIEGLKEFFDQFKDNAKKLILITKNIEKKTENISLIPIWKWILIENIQ